MNKPLTIMIFMSFLLMLFTLITRQQHLLPTLLCMEATILFIIFYMSLCMHYYSMNSVQLMIIMLTMSVSSTSIGLSLLIMISRKEGNDSTMLPTSM